MGHSGEKWLKVAKSEILEKVGKSGEKLLRVVNSGQKLEKVKKSGKKWEKSGEKW